jgi:cardiolipin synthase A/B
MLVYVPQRRSAAASRTWLLFIFLLPWPGLIAYLLFGRIYVPKNRLERQERASQFIRTAQAQMGERRLAHPELSPNLQPIVPLASRLGDFEPFAGNKIELLTDYEAGIQRLLEDIDQAANHVHLLYYIYGDDECGQKVASALERAAKRGVRCRVLLDAVGSKKALDTLGPRMRLNGIEVQALLPFHLFRRNSARFDLRNHRKIAVIDGRIGYTGSQNIVMPNFVKSYPNEELTVRITGPVVTQLQAVFLADQYFETGTRLEHPDLFPEHPSTEGIIAQVVPSGPGYKHENGQELMIAMLYAARKRVVISTPYFVPDESFLQAIRGTVFRGVDVHLILSKHANQLVTQLAQRSYYDELLEAGVKIHLYKPRFLHAKHFSVDDEIVLIGSTNIDIRSFALNAEVNVLLYGPEIVDKVREIQHRYFENSEPLNLEAWRKRPLIIRTIQNIARLADSFL